MKTSHIYIKNMVCERCIMVVRQGLENLGFQIACIHLGEAVIIGELNDERISLIQEFLKQSGLELIEEKKLRLIEHIKSLVIDYARSGYQVQEEKISSYLCRHLEHDYGYLSTLFSSFENITIERYLILQRIERVKELLIYNEQTLSAIAFQAGYGTVQYMTSQFKQYTGMTPKEFQKLFLNRRKFIDRLC